jgi:hypothetical protein
MMKLQRAACGVGDMDGGEFYYPPPPAEGKEKLRQPA